MDTFNLLMQVFFGWTLIIINIVVLVIIYNHNKHTGWLLMLISSIANLVNKIIATASSFWIRENVALDDLSSFGNIVNLMVTIINVTVYALSAYGLYLILKDMKGGISTFAHKNQNNIPGNRGNMNNYSNMGNGSMQGGDRRNPNMNNNPNQNMGSNMNNNMGQSNYQSGMNNGSQNLAGHSNQGNSAQQNQGENSNQSNNSYPGSSFDGRGKEGNNSEQAYRPPQS